MIDFRLYRVAWLPAVIAFVTMMFSLEGVPEPLETAIAPTAFDSDRARVNARQILSAAPERRPGGDGDRFAADLVMERFEAIEAGTASSQSFELDVDGEEAELRNVAVTLPGESERTILVVAARDSAEGPGAASSAAATAGLIELAEVLGGTDHTKTIVLVSTDAGSEGATGARTFVNAYPQRELIDAAIVLAQPGSAAPREPHVLRDSTDDRSTSAQLVQTAEQAIADVGELTVPSRSAFADLARLAMPTAAGEQAVLIADGLAAVALSSAGERPIPSADDEVEDLDPETLGSFGAAALAVVLALDQTSAPLDHGPDTYVEFAGNLIPDWALATLALALLMPAAVAVVDGLAKATRRGGAARALAWAGGLALPPLATLLFIYLLAVPGLVPSPRYPFDPGRFGVGVGELLVLLLIAAVAVAGYARTGLARPPHSSPRQALVAALGAASVAAALVSWLLNPYLALLLVPLAHLWLAAAAPRPLGRAATIALAALALVPALLALRIVTAAVGAGPWDLALMVANGHIGTLTVIALCPLAGALVGLVAVASRPRAEATHA